MQPSPILQRAIRRLPLTTKQGPHNYYKGNRVGAMGRHTKYGGYVIMYQKVRTYVVPDMTDFELTPFIPKDLHKPKKHTATGSPLDGKEYIRKWKAVGGNI